MLFQKISAWTFCTIGFTFLAVTTSVAFTPNPTEKDRSAAWGGLILGVPAMTGGLWILNDLKLKKRRQENYQLSAIENGFLRILVQSEGSVTIAQLARINEISLQEAEAFLEAKVKTLNGYHEIDGDGRIIYHFPTV